MMGGKSDGEKEGRNEEKRTEIAWGQLEVHPFKKKRS